MRALSLAGPGFARSRGRRATGRSFLPFQSPFGRVVHDDVTRPSALCVWFIVGADRSLGFRRRTQVSRLALRQQRLLNKLAVLDASKQPFSYWHVFRKPFTVITFVIVPVRAGVAVYFGYGLSW